MTITFNVFNQRMTSDDIPFTASETVNYIDCKFCFSDEWSEFEKTAIFSNMNGTYSVLLSDDMCVVPHEVLSDTFNVSVFGTQNGKNFKRITTNSVMIPVTESGYKEGETPDEPTPSVYETMVSNLAEEKKQIEAVRKEHVQLAADIEKVKSSVAADKAEISADLDSKLLGKADKVSGKGLTNVKNITVSVLKQTKPITSPGETPVTVPGCLYIIDFEFYDGTQKTVETYDSDIVDYFLKQKVDKTIGKDLSSNDYTDAEKEKVSYLPDSPILAKSVPHTTASGYPLTLTDALKEETLLDCKIWGGCGKNLIPYPYTETTRTTNGITFTDNGDGTITANGTTTANAYFRVANLTGIDRTKKYVLSGSSTPVAVYVSLFQGNTWKKEIMSKNGEPTIVDFPSYTDIEYDRIEVGAYIYHFNSGTSANNITIKPQLELGQTSTAYEKYKEVGDLSSSDGKYHIPICITSKNIWSLFSDKTFVGDGTTYKWETPVECSPNVQYTLSCDCSEYTDVTLPASQDSPFYFELDYTDGTAKYVGVVEAKKYSWTTDPGKVLYKIVATQPKKFSSGTVTIKNIQLEAGTSATAYEPYAEPSKADIILDTPLSAGDYVDLIRKKLTRGGVTILFPPVTVTGELKTLEGTNVIICSTAVAPQKIDIEYYQDINKVITELKNAILAQGGNT